MAQARLREALNAGSGSQKEKGPPVADGILSVTPDTQEALEWRSKRSIIDSAGTSSSYLEDDTGPKPSELYGKFTWKIENFSEVNKRELRSTIFEVGSYKWYILVYPQGCDVCNHLSLFLCVADYDKLLPGWSHFAQFTIAVVNKDPKKSKYSDTLHRFCKKEHDWGWKKFMELNKVLEGFTVSNTLVIKAQVQVIRDRPSAPFRCLEAQYRRELVRVYLSNVETLARKFVEEKREALLSLRSDPCGFMAFWAGLDAKRRRQMATASGEIILKGVVKRFFNEKEVTSTLVMDALVSGVKQIEECSRLGESKKAKKDKDRQQPLLSVDAERNEWTLRPDLLSVIDRAVADSMPASRDEGKPLEGLAVRNAQDVEDYSSNYVERDEKRLADLGRRAVEIYAVSHILRELESVHSMEESIKRQDALIKEEEENESFEAARSAARSAAEREKKARKKERQREKKAGEQAKKEAEDEGRRQQEAVRKAEVEEKAAAEASARAQEEQQREAERRAALRERAESYKAQEASRLQEAAEAAARSKQEEQAKLERQERPAAEPSVHAGEPSTAGPSKLSRASSSDESLPQAAPSRPNGISQVHDQEDGHSTSTAGDAMASTSTDTSDTDDPARSGRGPTSIERQPSAGPIRGHVEYLQAQLAASNNALAAARAEIGKLQAALSTAQRELSAQTREANESTQQLEARAREVNERSQEVAQLHAVIAELRQQVQAYEQQKAAAAPSVVTLGDLRGSMSDVDISGSSRPASSSSSLDMCGPDQQQPAQAKAAAQAATMKVRTGATSQSLDSPSDSPHEVRDVGPAAEVGSAASSSISSFSHRQGHAWPHGEQQGQHSRQPLANGQRGAPGRAGRAATPAQGSGGPKDSSAALAAASAAAAAALRPHRGTGPGSHAGSSGTGPGQGAAGQQHSQPVPINGGANAKTAAHKMLNGNAATFHPSSGTPNGRSTAESPTGPGMQVPAQLKNGVISYRNAAVGASNGHMAASSPHQRGMGYAQGHQPHVHSPMSQHSHHPPPPPPPGPNSKASANGPVSVGSMPQPPAQPHHALKQGQDDTSNASGLSRGNSNASSHATGTALPAESTNGYLPSMMYPAASGMQGGAQQPQPASSYTPLSDKKKDAPPQESPGLDDFAHMGMITNLLE